LQRDNLFIHTHSAVERVIIEDKKAIGVAVLSNAGTRQVKANREVILSAGTFNSPKILMLSGIGCAKHISKMGIQVHYDNAQVGQNLQDHPFIPVTKYLKEPLSLDALNHFPKNAFSLINWLIAKDNELANCAEMTG